MSIRGLIYKEIFAEYDELQQKNKEVLRRKKEEIYVKNPRIEEIDKELSMVGIKMTKNILNNPHKTDEWVASLKQENDKLIKERDKLLQALNYSKDSLSISYTCKDCKDTGYIEGQKCHCMSQKLISKAYKQSHLNDTLKHENFSTFNIDFYPDTIDPKLEISAKENINVILTRSREFCTNFDTSFENLMFYGETALGKTFICNCIAKELLDKGKIVLYLSAGQLFKMVEDDRFNKDRDRESIPELDDISTVDLLIIDDLGTEMYTLVTGTALYNFINTRLINKKSTIISTNLEMNTLLYAYSDRIISRINGNYRMLKFFGDDIREQKKHGNIEII